MVRIQVFKLNNMGWVFIYWDEPIFIDDVPETEEILEDDDE